MQRKGIIMPPLKVVGRTRYGHIGSWQLERILPISLHVKRFGNIERTWKILCRDRRVCKTISLGVATDEKPLLPPIRRLPIEEKRDQSGFAGCLGVRIIERKVHWTITAWLFKLAVLASDS